MSEPSPTQEAVDGFLREACELLNEYRINHEAKGKVNRINRHYIAAALMIIRGHCKKKNGKPNFSHAARAVGQPTDRPKPIKLWVDKVVRLSKPHAEEYERNFPAGTTIPSLAPAQLVEPPPPSSESPNALDLDEEELHEIDLSDIMEYLARKPDSPSSPTVEEVPVEDLFESLFRDSISSSNKADLGQPQLQYRSLGSSSPAPQVPETPMYRGLGSTIAPSEKEAVDPRAVALLKTVVSFLQRAAAAN
jgi:hypothetical protein